VTVRSHDTPTSECCTEDAGTGLRHSAACNNIIQDHFLSQTPHSKWKLILLFFSELYHNNMTLIINISEKH
jgi:hypothetical protein